MNVRPILWIVAIGALLSATGCRLQVDKSKDGGDKNVKIDTPLGGLHVRAGDTAASDVGLPAYPGAQISPDKGGDKSADVHIGFGKWQLRVKAVTYQTPDAQEKVLAFYQKALGRYGDVLQCKGNSSIGTPIHTREGLTCNEDHGGANVHVSDSKSGELSLKAGSKHHQHIVSFKDNSSSGTRFSLVELQLPTDTDEKSDEAN